MQTETDCRIDRSMGCSIPRELSILGISPGTLQVVNFLQSASPLVNADHQARRSIWSRLPAWARIATFQFDGAIDQEPTSSFVVEHSPAFGFIVSGVAHLVASDMEVMLKEEGHNSSMIGEVGDVKPPDQQVFMKIYHIRSFQGQLQSIMSQFHVCDQSLGLVGQFALP